MNKIILITLLIILIIITRNIDANRFEDFLVDELKNLQEVRKECEENIESEIDMQQIYYLMGQERQTERILKHYVGSLRKSANADEFITFEEAE